MQRRTETEPEAECWRAVAGFEGLYEVSDLGRVRSIARMVRHWRGGFRLSPAKLLSPNETVWKYLHVVLYRDGARFKLAVHRLVAGAFFDVPRPDQTCVNHKDSNRQNNRAANLEWCNTSENMLHAARHSLIYQRANMPSTHKKWDKLSFELARSAVDRVAAGESIYRVAKDLGVSWGAIAYHVKNRDRLITSPS